VAAAAGADLDRQRAEALDAADPLAALRDGYVIADPELVYFDGNSLGRLPVTTGDRLAQLVSAEWGRGLVRSWADWVDLPGRVGDLLGETLLGAAAGQVLVCDNTTVNLYKLAHAALGASPGRSVVVTDDDNFPTDRYVLEGVAAAAGGRLRLVRSDLDDGLDPAAVTAALEGGDVALVSLSLVAYRSGALADLAGITRLAHEAGSLVLWDLSHAVGAVRVQLDASGVDLAVGCTYKYVNAGPGAPAFLYVRRDLQDRLSSPIRGWFGQDEQFAMDEPYRPAPGVTRFLTGTPNIPQTAAVEEGVRLLAAAGVDALAAKARALTSYLVELADAWLVPLGFALASPRDPRRRGAHVTLRHPAAWQVCQAAAAAGVVGDYRPPGRLRLGPAPAYTRYVDVWDGLDRLRRLVAADAHLAYPAEPARVT